jgi:soluble lytic murein transglycosylase-like protein
MGNPPIIRNQYDWNEADLRSQYELAKELGWWKYFEGAAKDNKLNVEDLLAVASRESGSLWHGHKDGNIVGDHGKAWGLFQVNSDSNKQGIHTVAGNIAVGARILKENQNILNKKNAAEGLDFLLSLKEMWFSSYNRGVSGSYNGWVLHKDASFVTAHGNYGKDCIVRAKMFKQFIDEEGQV